MNLSAVIDALRSLLAGAKESSERCRAAQIVSQSPTLRDLYDATVADWHLRARKSFGDLERRWRPLFKHFGERCIAESITYDGLVRYAGDRLRGGGAPATVGKELSYLSRGFHIMERSGKLRTPPFPTITVKNARQEFIDDDEFFAIERELPEDLRPFFRFKWLTGWRNQEVASLTWARHVDWKRGRVVLFLYETKNDEAREFPFLYLPALETLLREQRARTDALERKLSKVIPHVFWRNSFKARDGRGVHYFRTSWVNACRRAGHPGKIPHDFRRTAIRRLEDAGVKRSVAKKLVGHKSDAAYERYNIAPPQDLAIGVEKLAAFMDGGAAQAGIGLH